MKTKRQTKDLKQARQSKQITTGRKNTSKVKIVLEWVSITAVVSVILFAAVINLI